MSRRPAPVSKPVALTIAGSDSGGGAGIQADIKTMAAFGVYPTSVVTSVTAQNTRGVERSFTLPVPETTAQYEAVVDDFDVQAAKTGMLAAAPVVEAVTDRVADAEFPLVVDPVMVATSGDRLLTVNGEAAYEDLLSHAALVTPNRDEVAVLTGITPDDLDAAEAAGEELLEMGADAALIKGGHDEGETVTDLLVTPETTRRYDHPRVDSTETHGSGCTLSAAITAGLAAGLSLEAAVEDAVAAIERAIRYPLAVGAGRGPVHHLAELRNRAARDATAEAVRTLRDGVTSLPVRPVLAEVGMNVVGATPYAEAVDETAAVEGRLTKTVDGITSDRPVRFGASSHVARVLLAAREHDPDLRFALNVKHDAATGGRLSELSGPVGRFDRRDEPEDADTMDWGTDHAFRNCDGTPAAVVDEGAVGKEPMIRLLASDADTLLADLRVLCGAKEGTD
ncbi:MAG: bifunctional hydroxymethylpyrimidine kinase/phosphomethylpyrimidine kinase [Halolamina sp.]